MLAVVVDCGLLVVVFIGLVVLFGRLVVVLICFVVVVLICFLVVVLIGILVVLHGLKVVGFSVVAGYSAMRASNVLLTSIMPELITKLA